MAITRRTHGAATAWTTSQSIPFSASATAGDVCYLIAENTAMPNDIAGWPTVASGTANGYSMKVYRKEAVYAAGDTAPTITGGTAGGVAWVEHFFSSTSGLTVIDAFAQVALDSTTGSTAYSATTSGSPTPTSLANDWLVGLYALKSSATMSANATAQALTQSGATVGTLVGRFGARLSGASPTNSLYYACYTRPVTTGATGAMTLSATGGTGAANVAGPAGLLLLREVANRPRLVTSNHAAMRAATR